MCLFSLRAVRTSKIFGIPASSSWVLRPTSRLSNRITKCPAAASLSQNSVGHRTIWLPSPMIRIRGLSMGFPNCSYSISIPLARAFGIGALLSYSVIGSYVIADVPSFQCRALLHIPLIIVASLFPEPFIRFIRQFDPGDPLHPLISPF